MGDGTPWTQKCLSCFFAGLRSFGNLEYFSCEKPKGIVWFGENSSSLALFVLLGQLLVPVSPFMPGLGEGGKKDPEKGGEERREMWSCHLCTTIAASIEWFGKSWKGS